MGDETGSVTEPQSYQESPVFGGIDIASFSFAFELFPDREERPAFRLDEIAQQLAGDDRAGLLEPFLAYHDDVTIGPPGSHGRPLVFRARLSDPGLTVRVRRPPAWEFERDGSATRLRVGQQDYELGLRESFCAFRSGRLFYIPSLTVPKGSATSLDEYFVIHLQHLAISDGEDVESGFEFDGKWGSLLSLARKRLRALTEAVDQANGLLDIIGSRKIGEQEGFRLVSDSEIESLAPEDEGGAAAAVRLRGLCIGIQNEALMKTAARAIQIYGHSGTDPTAMAGDAPRLTDPDAHNQSADPELFAYAGLTQAVIDFPNQDPGELSDATYPASFKTGRYVLFAHPAYLLQLASDWRPLRDNRDTIGACPYLMLTWLAAIHDNVLVSEFEESVNAMIFASPGGARAKGSAGFQARAFADLEQAVDPSAPGGADLLRRQLERRLDLFSTVLIHRATGLFRYPKEKADLAAALGMMGTAERFERMQALLTQVESMVEDITNNRHVYSDKRTNAILVLIAFLSIFSVASDVYNYIMSDRQVLSGDIEYVEFDPKYFLISGAISTLILVLVWEQVLGWCKRYKLLTLLIALAIGGLFAFLYLRP